MGVGRFVGAALCAAVAFPAGALGAASLPGAPPVTQSAFVLEPPGSRPVDNDRKIPAPSTPVRPACRVTIPAPSGGAVTAVQQRIDADVAAGSAFNGDTI